MPPSQTYISIIGSYDEYIRAVSKLVLKNPLEILVSSFSISVKEDSDLVQILSESDAPKKFLIGIGNQKLETFYLSDEPLHSNTLSTILKLSSQIPSSTWRTHPTSHLKLMAFIFSPTHSTVLCGGRNFSDSTWLDLTLNLSGPINRKIIAQFRKGWKTSKPLPFKETTNAKA